jgi:PAS domain S-box-containing protein
MSRRGGDRRGSCKSRRAPSRYDAQGTMDYADQSIQQALLAAIVESSDDAIVSKTLDGRILSWNRGAEKMYGYRADEVVGGPITIIIPPELHEEEAQILAQLRRGERIDHFETTRVARDGRRIAISLTVSPVRDAQGKVIGASKIARDISVRKLMEEAQRDRERLLSAEAKSLAKLAEFSTRLWRARTLAAGLEEMLDAAIELLDAQLGNVQILDPDRHVLKIAAHRGFSQEYLDFFAEVSAGDGSACGRALSTRQRIIIEDVEADENYAAFRSLAREAGYRSVVSAPLVSGDGTPLGMITTHFGDRGRPARLALDRLDLYLKQASDFIQRARLEEALRRNQEFLREADRRKDEFLALLAHELRNPLAPIRYALATTRRGGRTPEQQQFAEDVIERQVGRMSRLLDDLLDVSRITRGTLELKKAPTELTAVLGTAIETARPVLDARRHELSLDLPHEAVRLDADAVRLEQVFSNLLINAAKYTDQGGRIELKAVHEGNEVVVSVNDNGIGMTPDMIPKLFGLFSQANPALSRAEGGLGVGLALVKGLVTLHGGRVEARSDGPGRGSEFVVRLPVTRVAQAPVEEMPVPAAGAALRILVVDDNKDAADSCAILLRLSGHQVQVAYAGQPALRLAETFRPEVYLLDIGLPDLSGYEIAERIRAKPWGRRSTLVAITGWGQEEVRRRAIAAGFDHHLTKPVAAEAVEALLQPDRLAG